MVFVEELDLADDATAAAVHAVGLRAYRVEAGLIGFDGIPALAESPDRMRELPLRWLGVRVEGAPVAFLAWSPGEIDRLCVDPAWFRRGLATALLAAVVERTTGALTVTTGADNWPAVALYLRTGFVRARTVEPVAGLRLAVFALQRG